MSRSVRLLATSIAALAMLVASPTGAHANSFRVTCTSSHVANDDPIVYPGEPGRSHAHEFFGARSAGAHSTTRSLARSRTSCRHARDTASYWVPTLEVRGVPVRGTMQVYYQRAGKASAAAPPQGLKVIAGDARAARPQPRTVTAWQCVGRGRPAQHATVPACRRGERLGAWLRFPDCWDGRRLDAADHRSHLAYSRARRCPASHPVSLMRVAFLMTWPVRPQRASFVRLAGGMLPPTGMHGDFWNAWHQSTLEQLRWDCIELANPCGEVRTGRPAGSAARR